MYCWYAYTAQKKLVAAPKPAQPSRGVSTFLNCYGVTIKKSRYRGVTPTFDHCIDVNIDDVSVDHQDPDDPKKDS